MLGKFPRAQGPVWLDRVGGGSWNMRPGGCACRFQGVCVCRLCRMAQKTPSAKGYSKYLDPWATQSLL